MKELPLPYGIFDLDPNVCIQQGEEVRIRCFVNGCAEMLRPPTRGYKGEVCPEHRIRCHASGTYAYPDPRRNIIASPDLFAERIIRHPFKFESWRMGSEKSEDAVSWNVFRALEEAHCLHLIARWITGYRIDREPRLILWGIGTDNFQPWDLLIAARARFESHLPVKRPATEPDIALHLPGRILILIEAKFTSSNPIYHDGPRKTNQSLTKAELINIYGDLSLKILNRPKAVEAPQVYPQLWRNMVFAEWMAQADGSQPFLVNLTLQGREIESCNEFAQVIHPEFADRFIHLYWEDLFVLAGLDWRNLTRLQTYMLTKTAGLRPAFNLAR